MGNRRKSIIETHSKSWRGKKCKQQNNVKKGSITKALTWAVGIPQKTLEAHGDLQVSGQGEGTLEGWWNDVQPLSGAEERGWKRVEQIDDLGIYLTGLVGVFFLFSQWFLFVLFG